MEAKASSYTHPNSKIQADPKSKELLQNPNYPIQPMKVLHKLK